MEYAFSTETYWLSITFMFFIYISLKKTFNITFAHLQYLLPVAQRNLGKFLKDLKA